MTSLEEKERITRQGFFASFALLVPMAYAVLASNSSAVLADGLNLAMDTGAMYLSWHVIRRLKQGRTETYNYGFDKYENLLALCFALANLVFVVFVLAKVIDGLSRPEPLEGTAAAIILNIVAIGMFSALWLRVRRLGPAGQSPVMDAQRRYYQMSIADSLALVIPLSVAAWFKDAAWALYIDPVTAIGLCIFFLYQIWAMASGSVFDLVDRALEEQLQLALMRVLAARFDDYEAFHGVRTRRAGGVHFVEVLLGYDPALSMGVVQQRINVMKADLEAAIPNAVVLVCPAEEAAGTPAAGRAPLAPAGV
jgi:cation diffusion facilitator family transporter